MNILICIINAVYAPHLKWGVLVFFGDRKHTPSFLAHLQAYTTVAPHCSRTVNKLSARGYDGSPAAPGSPL